MAARNTVDPDLWWHLRTGQYIAEHRSVPHTDPFSYTRGGEPWVAHEWLSDLLLYQVERVAGWGGLIVLFAAILGAAFFLLYLRCGPDRYVAGWMTLAAAWATMPVWGVRPQVLSLLLTSLWLLILERSERTPRLLWWTIPLTLLWVNFHAGFALGLALSALFWLGTWLEPKLGFVPQSNSPNLRFAALILLLDFLVVPINPNGLRLFSYPIETLRSAAMQNYIAEWASPNFHRLEYLPFLLLVLATFATLSCPGLRVRPRDLLLLLVGFYAGLSSIRMMPLFVLVAAPLVAIRLGSWRRGPDEGNDKKSLDWNQKNLRPAPSHPLLNAVIVLAVAIFAVAHTAQVIRRQPQVDLQHFPVRAVAWLQAHPTPGPIFNHYDWGGYLIWKLYPATRVFIDGRADIYSEPQKADPRADQPVQDQTLPVRNLLDQFADTYQFKGAWRQSLEGWGIRVVLVPSDSALAVGLGKAPGWTIAYEDSQAVILTRGEAP